MGQGIETLSEFLALAGLIPSTTLQSVQSKSFPKWEYPYNLIQTEDELVLEVALAGISKDAIKVYIDCDNYELVVEVDAGAEKDVDYLAKGITKRGMKRSVQLSPLVDISSFKSVKFKNGLLTAIVGRKAKSTTHAEIK